MRRKCATCKPLPRARRKKGWRRFCGKFRGDAHSLKKKKTNLRAQKSIGKEGATYASEGLVGGEEDGEVLALGAVEAGSQVELGHLCSEFVGRRWEGGGGGGKCAETIDGDARTETCSLARRFHAQIIRRGSNRQGNPCELLAEKNAAHAQTERQLARKSRFHRSS